MPSNCPWCGSPEKAHLVSATHWKCGSYRTQSGKRRWQSGECRIRELEAELAGVEGLLAAASRYEKAVRNHEGRNETDTQLELGRARLELHRCSLQLAEAEHDAAMLDAHRIQNEQTANQWQKGEGDETKPTIVPLFVKTTGDQPVTEEQVRGLVKDLSEREREN